MIVANHARSLGKYGFIPEKNFGIARARSLSHGLSCIYRTNQRLRRTGFRVPLEFIYCIDSVSSCLTYVHSFRLIPAKTIKSLDALSNEEVDISMAYTGYNSNIPSLFNILTLSHTSNKWFTNRRAWFREASLERRALYHDAMPHDTTCPPN